ncbi:gluconeogenesis factor YvcK family protein [Granulicella sibirica]|uniref:Putative gluconeogenesis factor n=1 Tax=Granulicella sibirica TaxID=2479048 RepID=A0A4Q0T2U8_9BACT|nr:gluconeogenesis factor YvcK family protein [Granulicella sibirica]RXH56760.1 LPPG:FO 2-phospho-L-lactate transferase like, CofD-like [Granulicella sibirica]
MERANQIGKPLRVVAIGGGTGLSTLLRGLKRFVPTPPGAQPLSDSRCAEGPCLISDLAAVVTVTDDGGSSGRLREDMGMLPPGDVRNCMVALSEDEHLLSKLFQFRFGQGDLQGHSFGNLFVAALTHITGDFAQAVQMSSQILATRGRIYPATNDNVTLAAMMDDGSLVRGETNITASKHRITELMIEPETAHPLPETLEAIAHADLITLGPGSLFTSLITNLLVRGVPEAMAASSAVRVYVCNLMTQANESLGLTASQHVEKILQHSGTTKDPIFDYALINTAPISATLREQYAREGQTPIEADLARIRSLGVEPIVGNFVHEGDVLRHDYDYVAERLLELGQKKRMPSVAGIR